MKFRHWLLLLVPVVTQADPTAPGTIIVVGGAPTTVTQQTVIQLGNAKDMIETLVALPPPAPISVPVGSDLKILALAPGATYGPVRWFKNGQGLSATGGTLEIPAATTADSGFYFCSVTDANGGSIGSDNPIVFVSPHLGQRLLNYSVRTLIGPAQPSVLSGFVVEGGPANTLVLIRAVGPALASFGVSDPLANPKLQILDSSGKPVTTAFFSISYPLSFAGLGAFPLPAGSADVSALYYLAPGSYTAQVSGGPGQSGEVLLEVYEAPL